MTDAVARAAELLKSHRASIDRLDAVLIYTLGERFAHTKAVGQLKHSTICPPPTQPVRPNKLAVYKISHSVRIRPRVRQEISEFHYSGSHQNHKTYQE